MANKIYLVEDTPIVIADTTDYAGAIGTRTAQIDLTGIATTAARQSAKVDLEVSSGKRAQWYSVMLAIEFASAPASLATVDLYVGFSPSGTAGTANPGGLSGSDAAYTGTAGDSLADSLRQLTYLGSMVTTSDATTVVQYAELGRFIALERYACFVVENKTAVSFHSDAVEMGIRLVPLSPEVQ